MILDKFQNCRCIGCQTPYVQLIDDDILWFEIPKNGSSSIKEVLQKSRPGSGYIGISPEELKTFDLKKYRCYSITRNPYDRFLSAYNQFVLNKRWFNNTLAQHGLGNSIIDIIDNMKIFGSQQHIHHFYPQYYWIHEYHQHINFIEIDKMDEFFNILGTVKSNKNHFPNRKKVEALSDLEKQKIYELHKEDFDFFKYEIL